MAKKPLRSLSQQKADLEQLLDQQSAQINAAFARLTTCGSQLDQRLNKFGYLKKPLLFAAGWVLWHRLRRRGKVLRTARHGWRLFAFKRWWHRL